MNPSNEILFVSSYPPRECGLATYTQDLMQAISEKFGKSFRLSVCALENHAQKRRYGSEVKYTLNTSGHEQYIETAEKINRDKNIKAVFVQHEFGLFAGEYGESLLYFLYTLHKPVITTFHTILSGPDEKRRQIVKAIAAASDAVVVMTENSGKILREEYGIPAEKTEVIHHGTHLIGCPDRNVMKERYKVKGKYILSTFGLISSGKSIETALDALPSILEKHPDTLYYVIGKTHPEVVKHEGEKYREFLKEKIRELGISENVRFINRYLSLEELLEYLQLTDIYLFTSKDPNQAVSGTFSYAMGCSCPVISTPIPHAKEMLKDNAGVLVDFCNPQQLADAVSGLLSNPKKRKEISLNALHRIRPTAWQNSAVAHAELFRKVLGSKITMQYTSPEISLKQVRRMTTFSGMIQFSDICRPDPGSGYTLDDNARALAALARHYEITRDAADIPMMDTYLNFIRFAQQPDGSFKNYVDRRGKFHEINQYVNLEDSMGRAVWALGEFISRGNGLHGFYFNRAEGILNRSLEAVRKFTSPRAIAFAMKGLCLFNREKENEEIRNLIREQADALVSRYHRSCDREWKWFEDYLTYANSVLPESLLYAYLETGNELYKTIAGSSFSFLLSLTFTGKNIQVISNRGWHRKGEERKRFGEQPIDVAYTILTLDLFYRVFAVEEYREKMDVAFSWFHGNNHLRQVIYNPVTGGCQDGLEEHNVNMNQGAESTVCYLMAALTMHEYGQSELPSGKEEMFYEPIAERLMKVKVNKVK